VWKCNWRRRSCDTVSFCETIAVHPRGNDIGGPFARYCCISRQAQVLHTFLWFSFCPRAAMPQCNTTQAEHKCQEAVRASTRRALPEGQTPSGTSAPISSEPDSGKVCYWELTGPRPATTKIRRCCKAVTTSLGKAACASIAASPLTLFVPTASSRASTSTAAGPGPGAIDR